MLLKFNRDTELEVVGLGIFQPNEFVVIGDEEKAKRYLDSGYFDLVKEKKRKVKKSKKKGVDINVRYGIKRTHWN